MRQPSRIVWMNRIVWMTVLTGALLVAPGRAGAQGGNGDLKVTSFPSGANVSVDGADTGKVTPMSISLSVGSHTVVVSIPNSSWNPDTRTVDVESGNNDLSVTLLPMGTTGPPGTAATIQVGTTTTLGPNGQASVTNVGTPNAAILNFAIPQGQQGQPGAPGQNGAPGAAATVQIGSVTTVPAGTPASVLNVGTSSAAILNFSIPQGPSGGLIGRKEFQSSDIFVVPAGVSRLSVELYGAGGGGTIVRCNSGGGGGGGAYTSTIFAVQEGQTLTINVGIGGLAGASSAASGGNGGDTQVLDANGATLAVAHGGSGAQAEPQLCGLPPNNGAAGGASDPNAMISHIGASAPGFSPQGSGGTGYLVTGFAFQPSGQFGGGGAGALNSPAAKDGQGGYVLLSW